MGEHSNLFTGFTAEGSFTAVKTFGKRGTKENVMNCNEVLWPRFYKCLPNVCALLLVWMCGSVSGEYTEPWLHKIYCFWDDLLGSISLYLHDFFIGTVPVPGHARSDQAAFKLQCGRLAGLGASERPHAATEEDPRRRGLKVTCLLSFAI